MPTRRHLLQLIRGTVVSSAAGILPLSAAKSRLLRKDGDAGTRSSGRTTLLPTTLTLTNTSGSGQAANFVTRNIGHPFGANDVDFSAGEYPIFKNEATGRVVPYTMWGASTWLSDAGSTGYLQTAGFNFLIDSGI